MSLPPAEERKFQRDKLAELRYISFLLEWLAHKTSPGGLDLEPFQSILRNYHASQLQQKQIGGE